MAFANNLRSIFTRSSSSTFPVIHSQLTSIRLNATLTSPKLFISGLNRMTTDEKLRDTFASFGEVVDARVVRDRPTGMSKGFGFVTYSTIEEAENARQGMNSKFLDGWVVFVDPAKPREPRPPPQQVSPPQQFGYTSNPTVGWTGR